MIVNHDFDISEDLTVSPVRFLPGLGERVLTLRIDGPVWLRVEHEGHGQQPLDPF